MNKKRLSVVMAGAMLASSVAPIMAAEETTVEISAAQKGELVNELAGKIWGKPVFSTVSDDRVATRLQGKSVYALKIGGAEVLIANADPSTGSETKVKDEIKKALANVKVGDKVELVNLGYREVKEDNKTLILSTNESNTYSKAELTEDGDGSLHKTLDTLLNDGTLGTIYTSNLIAKHGYNEKTGKYELTLAEDAKKVYGKDVLELTTESKRIDFTLAKIKGSNEVKKIAADYATAIKANFAGFAEAVAHNDDIADVVEATYKISAGGNTYNTKDLYDGLFLTEKGYELLNSAKEVKAVLAATTKNSGKEANIVIMSKNIALENGKYTMTIKIANAEKVAEKVKGDQAWTPDVDTDYDVYHISGESKPELETLKAWLDGIDAKVDKIVGEERYTTAVKIAKEAKLLGGKGKTSDVVLVNGEALVDGLAAAPLAGYLSNESGLNAPILLTEKGRLPKATQRYLKELIDEELNKEITVHIVGGDAVVSDSVKRELRSLGVKVERYAGEDREATSMAVANEIGFDNGAFVVGATGEADAMSVSGFAASKIAPIVVSGFEGLSEDTIDALDGERVYVIGGDAAVSNSDFDEIKAIASSITRVSGSDRKETNAAVINKFYTNSFVGNTKSVIVANDGMSDNKKLVDALTVANLSAKQNAPIVLGTKELSKVQVNAIVSNAKTANKVYQIGGEIDRSVVKTIAEALKIVNK